jgi:hypothetical protein
MPQIAHPNDSGTIEVEIVDEEEYYGDAVAQVQAVSDDIELTSASGESPWVAAEQVFEE